jgi:hypothetical protein
VAAGITIDASEIATGAVEGEAENFTKLAAYIIGRVTRIKDLVVEGGIENAAGIV